MTLPVNIVLVRHGESEGNVATHASRSGDDSHYTNEFRQRHSSKWRLTSKGRGQALRAGDWLVTYLEFTFDRFFVSNYVRAMETAALLGLPKASWRTSYHLREVDWGMLDIITHREMLERYPDLLRIRREYPLYWSPPGGESLFIASLRVRTLIDSMVRQYANENVVLVCHGDLMRSWRLEVEKLAEEEFDRIEKSSDPKDRIHNCQILHYTRDDPSTGTRSEHLEWVRSVCPWDTNLSTNEWRRIVRPAYTNEQLLALVGQYPRMVDNVE